MPQARPPTPSTVRPRRVAVFALSSCLGLAACKGSTQGDGEQGDGANDDAADERHATPAPGPTPGPAAPDEPYVPEHALPPYEVRAPKTLCTELPKAYDDALPERKEAETIARVLRELSCDPVLHTRPLEDVERALRLPDGLELTLYQGGARLDAERWPPALTLARALGLSEPVARLEWQAYHDQWYLGDAGQKGHVRQFPPGEVIVMTEGEAEDETPAGTLVPLTEETKLRGFVAVSMPASAVEMGEDLEGLEQLATAIALLTANDEQLEAAPEQVASSLKLTGERWRVDRVTSMRAGTTTHGISLDPQRTRISASALVDRLGLKGARARRVNAEHGVWEVEVDGETDFPMGVARLSLRLSPLVTSGEFAPLDGAEVVFVTMMPSSD